MRRFQNRYDAEDHLVQRFEVWMSAPSPQLELGWAFAAGTQDEYGNALEVVASGGTGRGDVAWSLRDLRFVQDGQGVHGYYEDGGSYTRIVWGPGVDVPLARQSQNTNAYTIGTKWYLTDQQGSVLGLVSASTIAGQAVAAGDWAKVVTYAGAGADRRWAPGPTNVGLSLHTLHDEFEYAGRYTDYLSSLQYNNARWYSPATGQFMAKDSWGYAAGDTKLYRYAGNSFANGTDPSGHFLVSILAGAALTVTGAALGGYYAGYANGTFDPDRARAGMISGMAIGAGFGLMLLPSGFSQVAASTLLQMGMQSGTRGRVWDRNTTFDAGGWIMGMQQGALSGYISGLVGYRVGKITGGLAGKFNINSVKGQVYLGAGAGAVNGAASSFVDQYLSGERISGLRVLAGAAGGAIGGAIGAGVSARLARKYGSQQVAGKLDCQATQGPGAWLTYHLAHAASGAVGGAIGYGLDAAVTGEFHWSEMIRSAAMGAATSTASAAGQWGYNAASCMYTSVAESSRPRRNIPSGSRTWVGCSQAYSCLAISYPRMGA